MQNSRWSSNGAPILWDPFHLQNIDDDDKFSHYYCNSCISLQCYCEQNCNDDVMMASLTMELLAENKPLEIASGFMWFVILIAVR